MKHFLLAALLIPGVCQSQTVPYKEGKVFYSDTVAVEGGLQTSLYLRARKWIADTYSPSKDDILMEDKEAGIISSKASFRMHVTGSPGDNVIKFVLTIKIRQGKYKYELTGFLDDDLYVEKEYTLEEYLIALYSPSATSEMINSKVADIAASLKKAMTVKSDW